MEPNYGWPREETQEVMAERWKTIGAATYLGIDEIGSRGSMWLYAAPAERVECEISDTSRVSHEQLLNLLPVD